MVISSRKWPLINSVFLEGSHERLTQGLVEVVWTWSFWIHRQPVHAEEGEGYRTEEVPATGLLLSLSMWFLWFDNPQLSNHGNEGSRWGALGCLGNQGHCKCRRRLGQHHVGRAEPGWKYSGHVEQQHAIYHVDSRNRRSDDRHGLLAFY